MAISFSQKIKTLFELAKTPKELIALLSLKHSGYLKEIGWFKSFQNKIPMNEKGEYIPWFTYPFISFIEDRLSESFNVLEYGSGYSTLYFSKHCKNLISIESNVKWLEKIRKNSNKNVELLYYKLDDFNYVNPKEIADKRFNIIIVDAEKRNSCLKNSLAYLADDGVVILDDSDRNEYNEGIEFLLNNDFQRIDFWGISPGYFNQKCTSVFYRNHNCLKI